MRLPQEFNTPKVMSNFQGMTTADYLHLHAPAVDWLCMYVGKECPGHADFTTILQKYNEHCKSSMVLKPIIDRMPVVGGIQAYFLTAPSFDFDLTGILDSESERERMAVLSYLFRRVERVIEDRKPTIIVIDEAWKALDNAYFAERLSNWLVTARKQNTVAVMMTQYASQLERTRTGKTIVEAVPTQILIKDSEMPKVFCKRRSRFPILKDIGQKH